VNLLVIEQVSRAFVFTFGESVSLSRSANQLRFLLQILLSILGVWLV